MEKQRKDGLIENHAYSIMNAVSIHGEKLIQIRNPWVREKETEGDDDDVDDPFNGCCIRPLYVKDKIYPSKRF